MQFKLPFAGGVLAFAFAGVMAVPVASADETVSLKPKFTKGMTRYVEAISETESSVKSPRGGMDMKISKLSGLTQKVESTSMDGSELSVRFDRMQFALSSQMLGDLEYDSDIPSLDHAPYLKQMFEPMIGEALTFKLAPSAKANDVTGVAEILKKVEAASQGNPFAMGLRQGFNKELFIKAWDDLYLRLLPGKDVKVGDTWEYVGDEDLPQMGLTVKFDCTCKLDRLGKHKGKQAAYISYSGKASTIEPKMVGGAVPDMKIEKGEMKGRFVFNVEDGVIVEEEMESHFSLKSADPPKPEEKSGEADEAKPAAPAPAGMSATVRTKSKVNYLSMDERGAQRKENDKKAAEIKAQEEAEESADDEDESDDE